MNISLFHRTDSITLCVVLFVGMLILFYLGKLVAKTKEKKAELDTETRSLQGALLALLGLILAFSFSMSGNRYEQTRNILVQEANDIGTAVLRADLYNDSVRKVFRTHFQSYVEARIHLYEDPADTINYFKRKNEMLSAQEKLWKLATDQSKQPGMLIPSNMMLPALNSVFDIAVERDVLLRTQVPDLILYMLFILTYVSSFLTGLLCGQLNVKDWIIVVSFILFSALIIYTTLDLGRPLRGFIKTEAADRTISELRDMFK